MSVAAWVGIDVGTTGVKVVVSGLDGRELAADLRRYPYHSDGTGIEQDAENWWQATCAILKPLVADFDVRAVAVTSQAPTLVPVDQAGMPTGPALLWADRRALIEAREIQQRINDRVVVPDPYFGTAKLLWLARHRPAQLAAATYVLSCNGYIVHRLTGVACLDESTASMLQGWRPEFEDIDPRLSAMGVPIDKLAPIRQMTEIVGGITESAAQISGLPIGCPVAAGGIDAIGTALESAVLAAGDPFAEMTGFSNVGMVAVTRGLRMPGFINVRHCFADTDLVLTAQVTAGSVIDWLVKTLAGGASLLEPALLATRPRPNPITMVPSLAGERTPTWSTGTRGSVTGIGLDAEPADLVIAAMEGVALALAADIRQLTTAGIAIDQIRSTGGGARNPVWLQIKSDVLGLPVERPTGGSGAAQGAAYLAGMSIGDITGRDDLRAFSAPVSATHQPDPNLHPAYQQRLKLFGRQREFANNLPESGV